MVGVLHRGGHLSKPSQGNDGWGKDRRAHQLTMIGSQVKSWRNVGNLIARKPARGLVPFHAAITMRPMEILTILLPVVAIVGTGNEGRIVGDQVFASRDDGRQLRIK